MGAGKRETHHPMVVIVGRGVLRARANPFTGACMRRTISLIAIGVAAVLVLPMPRAVAQSASVVAVTDFPYVEPGTPFSAAAHGWADMIGARGIYHALTGQAAVSFAEAQRQFIENHRAYVENYFAERQLNREMRAKERGRRATAEDLVRYARSGAPERLSPSELDLVSGRVAWPVLLRDDSFATYRDELDKLFGRRAMIGRLSTADFLRIDALTRQMTGALQRQVAHLPPQEYVHAKRFVQSLGYEATLPPNLKWGVGMASQ
jgi:hypothetical protein